jgi:hypothetical protein
MAIAALTVGAGVQWYDAYSAAQAQGRVIVGGISAGGSVGAAGGWVLGGGHSILSPKYGLGTTPFFFLPLISDELRAKVSIMPSNLPWSMPPATI